MARHEIPRDGTPHAPTSECGCGPDLEHRDGRRVYLHVDQRPDDDERGPDDDQ